MTAAEAAQTEGHPGALRVAREGGRCGTTQIPLALWCVYGALRDEPFAKSLCFGRACCSLCGAAESKEVSR
jgi:hypothetical protein